MFDRLLWNSPQMTPISLLIAIVAACALIWLYLPQVRRLAQPWRLVLPGLRAAALIAVAVSILRPVVVRPRTSAEAGAIVVLIDKSRSMSLVDAGRSPAQLVALADGLGMLGSAARPQPKIDLSQRREDLAALTTRILLARGEFDYAQVSGQNTGPAEKHVAEVASAARDLASSLTGLSEAVTKSANRLAELAAESDQRSDEWAPDVTACATHLSAALDREQSAADQELFAADPKIRSACDELATASRFALAQRALLDPKRGLLASIGRDAPIFGFAVDQALAPVPLLDARRGIVAKIPAEATGRGTDLTAALRGIRERVGGQPIQAIVLFSDGRQVGGDPQLSTTLSTIGAPVFTVGVAGPIRRDIAISRLSAPRSLLAGQSAVARVSLRATGLAGKNVAVHLQSGGKTQTTRLTIDDNAASPVVQFPIKPSDGGMHDLRAFVDPEPGDACAENNSLTVGINVLARRVRVLHASSGRWDCQYVRNLLSRATWVDLVDQVIPDASVKLAASPEQILEQDVLILSDLHAPSLGAGQWQAVVKLVTERGGSVIIVPADARQLMGLTGIPGVADLLPMQNAQSATWRIWSGDEPAFRLSPPANEMVDAMRLSDDPAAARRRWNELPPFFRFMPVVDPRPTVRALLVERDLGLPVLTEARVGAGRSFFFGANETWRWRANVGERDQDQFWSQLIRYACEEPYAVHNGPFAMAADPMSAEPQEPIRIRAKVLRAKDRSRGMPMLEISRADGTPVRTQALLPVGAVEAGRFETIVDDLPPGEFRLRLKSTDSSQNSAALNISIRETFAAEMSNISGDDARLRRIAAGSGGQFIRIENVADLPAMIHGNREREPQFVEYRLWDSPYLFALVLGCLGTEWALRKRLGMV